MIEKKIKKPYVPLAGSDFIKPPSPKEQAIALIFALAGHGKTTLGLSYAPGPVVFFDIDKRGLHAARKATRKGKIIHYLPVQMPKKTLRLKDADLKLAADREVSRVRKNAEIAARDAQKGLVRTVVFDTMSEFGSLINMAVTGRVDKKKDDFGKSTHIVKGVVKDILEMFRETPANVIMLGRAAELWIGHEPTGKYKCVGLDTYEYEADWAAHLRLQRDKKTKMFRSQTHEMEITKAGIDIAQLGQVYTEEEWADDGPFVYACVQNYPGTVADSWR